MLTRSKTIALVVFALIVSSSAVAHTEGIFNPQANSVGNFEGIDSNAATGGAPTCTPGAAATNFLARTSALSPLETTATCTLINDLVAGGAITGNLSGAAGCGSVLDGFYFLATKDKTTAYLNLCGTSFGLTETATVTCTVDIGCAGNGTTGILDTNYVPTVNGVNYTQNSASIGAYVQTSRAANSSVVLSSAVSATVFSLLQPFAAGNVVQWDVNDATFPTTANTSSQGALIATRTGATATAIYRNGSSTALGTSAAASLTPPNQHMVLFALNQNGTMSSFSSDQVSCFFFGGALTGPMAVVINNGCNHAMTVLGANHIY